MLSDSAYNVVKKSATIVFPALSALYIALAQIWHFDHVEQVVGTLTAVNTCFGVLIQLSKKSYYASSAPYVGEIQVKNDGAKKVFSLVVDGDPEELENMSSANFKVSSETGETPVIDPKTLQ
ncbi:holin [Streptomyces phage ClubPenguin]|nr:holin [Streptomyces phage ClubPenguin]